AVALTDQSNLFAMVKFYRAAQARGIKPLIGVDLWLLESGERAEPSRLVLLCQNETGYRNLTRLVTRSYLEGQRKGVPMIEQAWIDSGNSEGLIALSGGREGDVGRALLAGREADASSALARWQSIFDDRYYLELQRTGREGEEAWIAGALDLAVARGVPVVATNDVRFLVREDFEAHEARVCIHDGTQLADSNRPRRYSEQQYLRSPAEMAALFDDLPEAIDNALEIARRCNLELSLGRSVLPAYPVPAGVSTEEFLRTEARQGLAARLELLASRGASGVSPADAESYRRRLDLELEVICQMGFAGYFLIVADFIAWSRRSGIPVGPGRGSGAGSLVAYSLGITDLDPLAYDLLFERFLNPERVSMPDFDIDFCMDRREEVISYVQEKYGRDRVAQIITFGTLLSKMAVRDVARVMQMSYSQGDRLSKLIPVEGVKPLSVKRARKEEPRLEEEAARDENVAVLLDIAEKIEGLLRNASTHAAGIVIGDRPLVELVPLYRDPRSEMPATQYNMKWVEPAGLVKFDFLGLKTLTVIQNAIDLLRERGVEIDISAIPLDDKKTYELYSRADTVGVFQVEGQG
ncbi:MAG TPA: DNA polymerase III subunit alpha, partial [Gammaproteobacteria bacterium]|nr:DNA polymerase III subunit alpha [Gammaproteobacteria bacterium]